MLQSPMRQWFPVLIMVLAAFSAVACGSKEGSTTAAVGASEEVQGTVKACHDGDTCQVDVGGEMLTVRLGGIDAPEVSGGADGQGQPYGKEARDFLRGLVKGKTVTVRKIELDPYGRTIGELFLGGKLVNIQLTQKGLAEAYKWATWKVNKQAYADAQNAAKAQQIGVWSLADYTSPADFRAAQPE